MINPFFWLVLSCLLVSVSLTTVLLVLVPTIREVSRAARSVEKLCNTLSRELPPTLNSIRQTSLEITELTDDVTPSVQTASRTAQQVNQSVSRVRQQAQRVQVGTRSLFVGLQAAWKTFNRPSSRDRRRLSPGQTAPFDPRQPPSRSAPTENAQTYSQLSPGNSVAFQTEEEAPSPSEQLSDTPPEAKFTPSTSNSRSGFEGSADTD